MAKYRHLDVLLFVTATFIMQSMYAYTENNEDIQESPLLLTAVDKTMYGAHTFAILNWEAFCLNTPINSKKSRSCPGAMSAILDKTTHAKRVAARQASKASSQPIVRLAEPTSFKRMNGVFSKIYSTLHQLH